MNKRYESSFSDSIKPISMRESEFIIEQMKTCICKIHLGSKKGTGFFIKIPFRNQSMIVLMTNYHVLNETEIADDKIITVSLNNETVVKNIRMDFNRRRYINPKLDVTIIEILKKDYITNYLTLDKQIINRINLGKDDSSTNYISNIYTNESLYILGYINAEEIFASYGLLNKIDKTDLQHKCYTGKGSSGSPILLLKSKTVIGIHSGGLQKFNLGLFLLYPLLEFQNISNNITVIKSDYGINNISIISENDNVINKKVDKIYNDVRNYYISEWKIINIVNNKLNQAQIYQGFLVEEKWVEKWKKYSNYQFIKINYLDRNISDEKIIKQAIDGNLRNANLNYDEINDIEKNIIKYINQLKLPENKNKSYYLLDANFLKSFPIRLNISSIGFYLSYQNIQLYSQNTPIIVFKTNNNKITNISNEYNSECLKHLIKYTYLKKELQIPTRLFKNNFSEACIINREVIYKLKKIYNLDNLISKLERNQILNGVTYLNFEQNYNRISEYLNKNEINYINSIKTIETHRNIHFTEDETSLKPKCFDLKEHLKYYEDFAIIGIKFAKFFKQNFDNVPMFLVKFVEIDNMFLLIVENEPQNYYQITNEHFSNEYYVEIIKNNVYKDKISLNNFIYNAILKNGIQALKSKGNPISFEKNKIVFNLLISPLRIYAKNNLISFIPRKDDNLVTFIFEISSQRKTIIRINECNSIKFLIHLYFDKIQRPDLYGNPSIRFLYNEKILNFDSEDRIKSLKIKPGDNKIFVDDLEDKLKQNIMVQI